MSRVNDKARIGLEVHLRAFCCKATGGGGSLATSHRERSVLRGQFYFSSHALPGGIASADLLNLAVTGRGEK